MVCSRISWKLGNGKMKWWKFYGGKKKTMSCVNECTASILVTTKSQAHIFLQLELLDPLTCILATVGWKDASRPWSKVILSHLYLTKKTQKVMCVTFPSSCRFNSRISDFTHSDDNRQWWTSYWACYVNFCKLFICF